MPDKNETLYVVHSWEDAYEKPFLEFEGVTNNFNAWLKEHNKIRAEKGCDWCVVHSIVCKCNIKPLEADDFWVEELKISYFNKEKE
tara:strand:+ start:348 stop:605 length:258 start_codon:yes stop_codon:yes gene_type:complete